MFVYALKTLKAHGLQGQALRDVIRASGTTPTVRYGVGSISIRLRFFIAKVHCSNLIRYSSDFVEIWYADAHFDSEEGRVTKKSKFHK